MHQTPAQRIEHVSDETRALVRDHIHQIVFEAERTAIPLETAMELIELSERYGSLRERRSILILADALFRAREHVKRFAMLSYDPSASP